MSSSSPPSDPDLQDMLTTYWSMHGSDAECSHSACRGRVYSVRSTQQSCYGQVEDAPLTLSMVHSMIPGLQAQVSVTSHPPSEVMSFGHPYPASIGGVGLSSDKKYMVVQVTDSSFHFSKYCLKTIGQCPCISIATDCVVNHQGDNKSTMVEARDLMVEWNVLFAHANSTKSADEDNDISEEEVKVFKPVTHADISAKEEFAAQANSFRTPLKRKVNVLSEPAYLAFSPYKKQWRDEDDLTLLSHEDLLALAVKVANKVMDNGLSNTINLVV
eukprot:scaffold208_cov63-Attheya_sp.AAC.1